MERQNILQPGTKIKFVPKTDIDKQLLDFLDKDLMCLKSIKAYCVADRIIGRFFGKKQTALILFFDLASDFESDKILIDEKIKYFFSIHQGSMELIPINMADSDTLRIVKYLDTIEAPIIEKQ